MEFSSNCALFVCNKWDNIPSNEAVEVMNHITTKLSQCLPDLDPERQIMRLSTTKALIAQKFNIMNEEFALLTQNIGLLVKKSIEKRLEQHWGYEIKYILVDLYFDISALRQVSLRNYIPMYDICQQYLAYV